jgi:predicted PurR-regulated permease PerM
MGPSRCLAGAAILKEAAVANEATGSKPAGDRRAGTTLAERARTLRHTDPAPDTSVATAAPASWPPARAILRVIFIVLGVALALWLLHALKGVILLVVLAVFFAYLVSPLVDLCRRPVQVRGRRRDVPRGLAIVIVYLALFGSLGTAAYVLLPRLGSQTAQFAQQAPAYVAHIRERVQGWSAAIKPERFPAAVRETLDSVPARTMAAAGQHASSALTGLVTLLGYLPWLVLVPILAFFLLKDVDSFRREALLLVPRGRLRWQVDDLLRDVNRVLASYVRAQLLACLLVGVVCTIGFILIDVPYALVLGLLSGLLEFIPLVGPLVIAGIAVLVASFHSFAGALAVLLFLVVLRLAQDYVVYPRLIGLGVRLHPLAVILAILCGAELGGVAGIFLAIPAVAVLSVGYQHWLAHRAASMADVATSAAAPRSPSVVSSDEPQGLNRPRA